jgi:hypothetical protein
MGKTPERRVFTSSGPLRYRRKVPAPADNQQPEPPTDRKTQLDERKAQQDEPKAQQEPTQLKNRSRSSRSPSVRRFRPKPKQNQNQPALLKQLLWKAKAVQPTPAALQQLQLQQQQSNNDSEEEEGEEEAFAAEQRQARKLLASEAEALAASKSKAAAVPSVEPFVAESSSQETQSGSEDEAAFLPYGGLVPVQPPVATAKWQVYEHETDAEEAASPVIPAEAVEAVETGKEQEKQDALEKAAAARRKQRQKYKLKQKQKRAAAKEQKRIQHQQKQMQEAADERPRPTEEDAAPVPGDEDAAVDIFHPSTNLASEMDAGVCRAVLTQLEDVVPCIVVGDVACPVVAESDGQPLEAAASDKDQTASSEGAIVDFRQHVIAMLDRSKETQMQYRNSFVVQDSGFDAASSYDFFKRRKCATRPSVSLLWALMLTLVVNLCRFLRDPAERRHSVLLAGSFG